MKPVDSCSELLRKMYSASIERPDDIAICDRSGTRKMTFSEFWKMTGRMSNLLRSKGVGTEDVIVIDLGKNTEHIAARYAIACVGGVSISLSDNYPVERKKEIIRISDPKIVIDDGFCEESVNSDPTVIIDDLPDNIPGIILFTSGSTGKPKGVIHARSLFVYTMDIMRTTGIQFKNKNHAALSDISFIASFAEISSIMGCCATISLIDDDIKKNPEKLSRYFAENDIFSTVINPSMFKAIGETLGLECCFLVGEVARNIRIPDGTRIFNIYGSTEVIMSMSEIEDMSPDSYLDRSIADSHLFILDEKGNKATKGEICYSGKGMMLGYLGESNNAFSFSADGERIYHTRDLGIQTEKGIAVIGRLDDMVKINGNRVETAEVEDAMEHIDGVLECAVKAFKDDTTNYLCGYFTSDKDIDPSDIQKILSTKLPYYMVPPYIRKVDDFTRNMNGKIDRSTLPDLRGNNTEYVPPENEMQKSICDAFSAVLGHDRVGIDDDFVLLGGTSIKAMSVQKALDFNVKTSDILLWRTPRLISENVTVSENVCEHNLSFDERCPLNDPQMDTYLDDTVRLGRTTKYNNPFRIIFRDNISFGTVESLIDNLIQAHPIMRMRIDAKDGVPFAIFDCAPVLERGDPTTFVRPFDLSSGPLCRFLYCEKDGRTILYADFHHLISDGTSMSVLISDIESLLSGGTLGLDDGILYSIARDRNAEKSGEWKKSEEYYDRLFEGRGTLDAFLPDLGKNEAGIYERKIGIDRVALESFFTKKGITTGVFFEAVFAYTLSRFTGDPRVLYCNIVNGRDGLRIPDAVGMFVRTVPTITDCSDRPILEFIKLVADAEYEKSALGPYPSRELARKYGVTTAITFQYSYDMASGSDVFSIEPIYNVPVGDFGVNVSIRDDSFVISIPHSEKYSEDKVSLFAKVYEDIVRGFIQNELLSEIRIATDACIERMDAMNETAKELRYTDVLSAFSKNVQQSPDRICLSCDNRMYSFSVVDRVTNGIANSLVRSGIKKGDYVAFLVPRGEWYVICIIGILKAGAAYVPIDRSYPTERKSFLISDSGSKAILVVPDTVSEARELTDIPTIDASGCDDFSRNDRKIDAEDPFCVLYTSGTTGTPKGSVIRHISVENYAEWFSEATDAGADDIFAFYNSIGFDAHMEVIITSLIAGSRIDIVPDSIKLDLDSFADFIVRRKITQVDLPTSVARIFVNLYPDMKIKCLTVGGEKFGELSNRPAYRILDTYGPTEATISVLATDVADRESVSSVGRAIYNCKVFILDAERRRVPYGAVGELCVAGHPVSLGYLNRKELNDKAFFEIDIGPGKKEMVYSTGDYFRYLPGGSLEFVGRRDDQMKIMGNRVEPAEIETVIRKAPHVVDVTVQPFVSEKKDVGLCAYVVLDSKTDEDSVSLSIRSFVSERKPSYMVPSQIVILDSIPLNVNGKVDKRSLPIPKNITVRPEYVAPGTDEEKRICNAISETLNVKDVGMDDDFLLLGGDSLKSIRVASLFNSADDGKRISAIDVLRYRTPRTMSKYVTDTSVKTADYDITDRCPLSDSQIAFYDYAHIPGVETNVSAVISIDDMDSKELRSAIVKTVGSHPMLKSHIVRENGRLWNVFDRMPEIIVTDEDPDVLSKGFFRHFDVDKDVLSRFAISNFGGKCHLLVDFSHMIFDGRSTLPFVESVLVSYSGAELSLDDGMLKQLAFEESVNGSTAMTERIRSVVESFKDSDLSDPFSKYDIPDGSDGICRIKTDIAISSIDAIASKYDSSTGVFLSAVFGYTLSEFTSRDDVVFHLSHDGRDAVNLENSIGMYVRYVPIRVRRKDDACLDFVKMNIPSIYDSMSTYVPLWKICESIDLRPHVIFQYQHFLKGSYANDMDFEYRAVNRTVMKRISFDVVPTDEGIEISILHPKGRLGKEMESLANLFLKNLRSLLD